MPKCRFDDWTRLISSVGVLCLLGLPGMFFPHVEAPSEECAVAPDAVTPDTPPPAEAPTSKDDSEKDDEKGIDPQVIMAAVKHDQLVPRRDTSEDERPRVRPLSRRDTGKLDPDADRLNGDERPQIATLFVNYAYEFVSAGARIAQTPQHPLSDAAADPAIGTAVRSLAPPRV